MTSPERQPLLHDLSVTLAAPTVVLSRPDGNLDAAAPGAAVHGLFHADVRAVSLLRVTLRPDVAPSDEHPGQTPPADGGDGDGADDAEGTRTGSAGSAGEGWLPVVSVMNAADGPGRSRFVGLAQTLGDAVPDPTVRVDRRRTVTPGRLTEQLTVRSTATTPVHLAVRVEAAGDLVTLDHTKAGLAPRPPARPTSELLRGDGVLRWGDGVVRSPSAPPARRPTPSVPR